MTKAAVGQICSSNSMAHNLEQCVKLVGKAAAAGAKILFLPEASDYISTSPEESLSLAQPVTASLFVKGLQAAAKHHSLAIHAGVHIPVTVQPTTGSSSNPVVPSVPQSPTSSVSETTTKLYNSTLYIHPTGTIDSSQTYNKLHLFDYGSLRESSTTQAGNALIPPVPSPIGRLGSLICFDLRFPEPSLHLTRSPNHEPAHVLLYPSAFTVATGYAHWQVLLRARAIETQSFVIASAQVGCHNPGLSKRVSYGRSTVIDPWGRVLLELKGVRDDGEDAEDGAVGELGIVDINLEEWERVREKMPLVRRTDVYPSF
ncbi:carbon-nitrogen hydrolase [Xylariaceae sp. FL0016]|nr:carbon-nitrogen hydrolase [Xylariaceae sp. FL0016]